MYDINMGEVSEEFQLCWSAAGQHLDSRSGSIVWLRAHLHPPMVEHMSFRLGNQIFFIQLYDVEGFLSTPNNNVDGLVGHAELCNAIPCLLPMKKIGNEWHVENNGWGLINPISQQIISPEELITDEVIEMSDWEIQDMAVTIIKNKLEESGKRIMSWQSDPLVYPSLWYEGDTGPEYVVVGSARRPIREAKLPLNIENIKASSAKMSGKGYFVSVVLAAHDDPFDPNAEENGNFLPLIRGLGMFPKIGDMESLIVN